MILWKSDESGNPILRVAGSGCGSSLGLQDGVREHRVEVQLQGRVTSCLCSYCTSSAKYAPCLGILALLPTLLLRHKGNSIGGDPRQLHCSSSLVQQAGGGGGKGGISCTKKSLRINFPEESTGPGGQAGHRKDAEDAAVAPHVAHSRHTAEKTLWRSTNSALQKAFQGAAYSPVTCTAHIMLHWVAFTATVGIFS